MSTGNRAASALVVRNLCMGLRASQALYVAVKLGIADHLAARPMRSAELATATNTHAVSLRRLLRALSALGVFAEQEPDCFALTPVGELLRSGVPGSLRAVVLFLTGEVRWRCWANLVGCVRTGEPAAERVLGMPLFDYYAAHPEESAVHDEAMAAFTSVVSAAVLDAYDFSRFRCLVDVGGGTGQLLSDILRAHPALQGVLLDLPHVLVDARGLLSARGVADRCRIEGGSFFDAVPKGGDAYLLKNVIHDWDDPHTTAILVTCRKALPPEGTLLVLDRVLSERAEPGQGVDAFLLDLEMLTMAGGRERTESEFRELFDAAGFALVQRVPTTSPLSIIVGRPT